LRPNEKDVAAKVVDGEAVIINLSNGVYYSLDRVGGVIWELLDSGRSLVEIVELVTERYDVSADRVQADLEHLAAQLVEERIVEPADGERMSFEPPAAGGSGKLPYEQPRLEIFRDIGHLFALDPPMPGLREVTWDAPSADAPQRPAG
jgi:hypothetical protein